jgi:hypothetical protein
MKSLLNPPLCVVFVWNPSMFCSNPRFDLWHVLSSSTNNFAHSQALSRISSLLVLMNITRVNIGFFSGFKKIKQRLISFGLGYLRMILRTILSFLGSVSISPKGAPCHSLLPISMFLFSFSNKLIKSEWNSLQLIIFEVKHTWNNFFARQEI